VTRQEDRPPEELPIDDLRTTLAGRGLVAATVGGLVGLAVGAGVGLAAMWVLTDPEGGLEQLVWVLVPMLTTPVGVLVGTGVGLDRRGHDRPWATAGVTAALLVALVAAPFLGMSVYLGVGAWSWAALPAIPAIARLLITAGGDQGGPPVR
jgi:hypothetical protein